MSTGKVLLGVLAGVAAGATLGILFAPDKGVNTRRKISQKSNEYADDLGKKFNEFVDTVKEKLDTMRNEVAHKIENGQPVKEKAKEVVDAVTR